MFKNLTIHQLASAIAIIFWSINAVCIFIVFYSLDIKINFIWLVVGSLLALSLGYFLVRYLIEVYFFRKVKLIYKLISDSKQSIDDQLLSPDSTISFDEVEDQVLEWADNQDKEIHSLKTLEQYRKTFVGNVSHELKTPIFAIQGYLHSLLEGGLYDESVNKRYIERSIANTERLQTIVEDLEVINRLEENPNHLDLKPFMLKDLSDEIIKELEIISEERNISVEYKPGAEKNFQVYADRNAIKQVLVNLLTNSLKYGKPDGLTKISYYDMVDNVLVEISDNGIGISEEHLVHLYDRFYRVDKSRSRDVGGSGLGLSIVKHIIEAHHQNVMVRSTEDVGSTFGFTLQRADKRKN